MSEAEQLHAWKTPLTLHSLCLGRFIVGTQSGALLRGHRFQDAAGGFRAFERTGSLAAVTALACHPFLPSYFLAGFDDGGIR